MKAYLFRPEDMGKKSCEGIAKYSKTGIFVVQSQHDRHPEEPHLCIRYGCRSRVPQGRNVLNKLGNMDSTMNKGGFRKKLQEHGLCPPSWGSNWGAAPEFPCVVRPGFHAKSQHFYLCHSLEDIAGAARYCGDDFYCSKFIDKKAEYRINVLQGRVLCVIEKSAKDQTDITFSRGATEILYWSEWPIAGVSKAIKAVAVSGLDFAGVDVIEGKDGECYVLELNTCPYLEGSYQQQCFARGFDWVVEKGRDHFSVQHTESWKNYIHPCMSELARV